MKSSFRRRLKAKFPALGLILFGGAPQLCWAAAETNALVFPGPTPTPTPTGLASVVHVFGALLLTLAVFFGALWFWRNGQRFLRPPGKAPKLTVLEARSLGQRQTLFVIGYEEQRMLISSSPTGVNLLTALPPGTASGVADAAPQPATPGAGAGFASYLLQAIGQRL